MKIVSPEVYVEFAPENGEKLIEKWGRTCYKSEDKITEDSYVNFIKHLIARGHESVLEHINVTLRIICDRGVSHELVRHRHMSFSQESTRYCNYSKDPEGISFIMPVGVKHDSMMEPLWFEQCESCEGAYLDAVENGVSPQKARSILNNSLKTELIATANLREWRLFIKLRASKAAHPDMRVIAKAILLIMHNLYPVVFDDLYSNLYLRGN